MKKFCIEIFRAMAALVVLVALLICIRWLLLTETLAGQVIAALLVLGLLAAMAVGAVFTIIAFVKAVRTPKVDLRCGTCTEVQDCPAAFTGVAYPCPYYKECNTKKEAAPGDQDAAHK